MHDRISLNSSVRFGKACVVGTRITVEEVLELVRAQITNDEFRATFYPELTNEDIEACLAYGGTKP